MAKWLPAIPKLPTDQAMRFIVIIALVGVVLGIAVSFDPQIPILQRAIADQTSFFLNVAGIEAGVYNYWVTVPTVNLAADEVEEIKGRFRNLSLVVDDKHEFIDFYGNAPDKTKAQTIEEYVHALRARGIEAGFEPATIVTPAISVSIVPGCTGWLGIATLIALILAYPNGTKSRVYGIIMALGIMYTINIFRITSAIWATNAFGAWVWPLLEPLIWRWGMLAAAFLLWLFWLKCIADSD